MCQRSHLIKKLLALSLFLPSCQFATPTPYLPRVPEVISTVKAKMFDSSGIITVNSRTGYVYVAGTLQVTVFKGADKVAEIDTGGINVEGMALNEANGLVYAVNRDSDNVTVISGTERIGIVPTVGKQPTGIAVDPHSGFAYVVSTYESRPLTQIEGNVLVISGSRVVGNLKLGRLGLWHIVADPVGGYVYAGDLKGTVVIFKGMQEVARYELINFSLSAMNVNTHTGEVYVLASQSLYRLKEGKLIDSVKLKANTLPVWQLAVHPTTGEVYIPYGGSTRGRGHVLILRDMKEIGDVEVGSGPSALAIDPLTGNVYVASKEADTVTVINGTRVLATIKVGWYPIFVGVNPANGWVYTSNIADGTVTILGYPSTQPATPVLSGTTPTILRPPTSAAYP